MIDGLYEKRIPRNIVQKVYYLLHESEYMVDDTPYIKVKNRSMADDIFSWNVIEHYEWKSKEQYDKWMEILENEEQID